MTSLALPTSNVTLRLRKRLEEHIDELPVLPSVVAKLMALDRNDPRYFAQVQALVATEPSFCARVLASANSAASAPRRPITTLAGAILRIGSASASNLVLAISVTRVFVPRDDWQRGLWRHALQVAIAACSLAGLAHDEEVVADEVYTAALLHDVGRFVMLQDAPDDLRRLDESSWGTPEELLAQERRIFGVTHAELGELACRRWQLPDTIANVVRDHHTPQRACVGRVAKITALVRLADVAMFSSTMPGAPSITDATDGMLARLHAEKAEPLLGISLETFEAVLKRALVEADDASRTLGLG